MSTTTDILQVHQTLTDLEAGQALPKEVKGHHLVVTPPEYKLHDITAQVEKAQPIPNRKQGTVALQSLDSLLTYCTNQESASTGYIYADTNSCTITAVFNDHRAVGLGGWRDHRAQYKAEKTKEFDKWVTNNCTPKTQTEFAEFIEDNYADLVGDDAAKLLEVATTIQAKTDINFSSAKRLQNGQTQLVYSEVIDARAGEGGALQVPKEFLLGLRIFNNGAGYKLKARLKYRLHGGSVKFWYELDRPHIAIEDAFNEYIKTVADKSGYTVLLGTA